MKQIKTKNSDRVYGIIGMVALFLVGVIFGFVINGSERVNPSTMSKQTEKTITKIVKKVLNLVRFLIGLLFSTFLSMHTLYALQV